MYRSCTTRFSPKVLYTSHSPSNASAYVVAPISALINNDYENVDIDSLELTVKSTEEPLTATVERVWLDDTRRDGVGRSASFADRAA